MFAHLIFSISNYNKSDIIYFTISIRITCIDEFPISSAKSFQCCDLLIVNH